jgi:hypothetical protein
MRGALCHAIPRSHQDSVLGSRWIRDVEQAIRGRDVRDAAGAERGGTSAGDHGTGVGCTAERNRPEPGQAAEAISALWIKTFKNIIIFLRFLLV